MACPAAAGRGPVRTGVPAARPACPGGTVAAAPCRDTTGDFAGVSSQIDWISGVLPRRGIEIPPPAVSASGPPG